MHVKISSWLSALFWSNDLITLSILSTQYSKIEVLSFDIYTYRNCTVVRSSSTYYLLKKLLHRLHFSKNQPQVCDLPLLMLSMGSCRHWQIFSKLFNICFGCYLWLIKVISKVPVVFKMEEYSIHIRRVRSYFVLCSAEIYKKCVRR